MGATRVSGSSSGACGRGAGERPSTPASPATLAASLASTVGKRGLVLGESIGSGAYAKVKSAHYSNAPERRLAVKIVSRKRAPAGYMDKFLPREIKALRRLSHPHVIGFVDTFASLDNTYIVMEHAARGDLLEYINAHGRFPEPGARRLFMQLASAVGYCHSMRVVHRDLKCENILLDHNLNLKLSDFGFAALLHPQEQHLHTHCGSYAYAAPEILNAEDYKGTQTDVWSMGVVLFAMLCGKLPFCDKDFKVRLPSHQQGEGGMNTDNFGKTTHVHAYFTHRLVSIRPCLCRSRRASRFRGASVEVGDGGGNGGVWLSLPGSLAPFCLTTATPTLQHQTARACCVLCWHTTRTSACGSRRFGTMGGSGRRWPTAGQPSCAIWAASTSTSSDSRRHCRC